MNFDEYQSEASQTALYPRRLSNLEYPTLGLTGEAGEVANVVKKIQRDHGGIINDEIRAKLKDELGDVLWYISACADELGMRPLVAHCHLGLGSLDRHIGDGAKARQHLTTATALYREMGMAFWLEKAEAVLGSRRETSR